MSSNKRAAFVFGSGRSYGLVAISLLNGKILWVAHGPYAFGVVTDDTLYALKSDDSQGSDAFLVAINANVGQVRRVTRIADCGRVIGVHAVRKLVIAVCADRVVAADITHGGIVWNIDSVTNFFGYNVFETHGTLVVLAEDPDAEGTPTLVDGIDVTTGRLMWRLNNVSFAYATSEGVYLDDLSLSDTGEAHIILADWATGSSKRSFLVPFPQPEVCNPCAVMIDFPYALFYIAGLSPNVQRGTPDTRFLEVNLAAPFHNTFVFDPKGYPVGQTPDGQIIIIDAAGRVDILDAGSTPRLATSIPGSRTGDDTSISIGRPPFERVLSYDGTATYLNLPGTQLVGSFQTKCISGSANATLLPAGLFFYCQPLGNPKSTNVFLLKNISRTSKTLI